MNKNNLQASEPLQPYFKSRKGIGQTSLRRGVFNKIRHQIFVQQFDNFSTFSQPRILFWFTSSGFLKRPVSL